jgi:hypothetical protein
MSLLWTTTSPYALSQVMTSKASIRYSPLADTTPELARDARARAWAYVFSCFNRRAEQEGSPTPATLGNDGSIKGDSADARIIPNDA